MPYQTEGGAGGLPFGILAYYLSPRSRGRVRLKSRAPVAPPAIDLGLPKDAAGHGVRALVEGVRLIYRLTRHSPLADAIRRGPRRFTSGVRLTRLKQKLATAMKEVCHELR